MRRHLLAIAVILTVAPGCDNVAWGGVDVRWEPPTAAAPSTPADLLEEEESETPTPPEVARPLLLAGTREAGRAAVVVVGELRPDGIAPATATSSGQGAVEGSEWILFADGVRVGRLTADYVGAAREFCGTTATVAGVVELVPTAGAVTRVLALPATEAHGAPFGELRPLTHQYEQRVASLGFAQKAIPRLGAPWPEGGVLPTRQDIQAFQPLGTPQPTVAATYLVRDQLMIGPAASASYALFILAAPAGGDYRETFEWYHAADAGGKGVPRYFSHLDWDGDGRGEILLDVFGSDRRWFAALEQRENGWERTFENPCGAGASPGR